MNRRLFIVSLFIVHLAAACASAPYTPAPLPLGPSVQEAQRIVDQATNVAASVATGQAVATQQAQATLDTAARDATAIAQLANARATESAVILAPTQTIAAATAVSAQSTQAFVTAATAQSITATEAAEAVAHDRQMESAWSIFWMIVVALPVLALTAAGSAALLRVARSHKLESTFEMIYDESGKVPLAWRVWKPSTGWTVHLMQPTRALGPSPNPDYNPDPVAEARAAWAEFVKDVARAASLIESWSINKLSTRKGGHAVASEDAIEHARTIAVELGALVDYGSNRGLDWAAGWDLPRLCAELDAAVRAPEGGAPFTLPHRDDQTIIPAPTADLSQCNATQSNAANARNTQVLFTSPIRSQVHS